MVIINVIIEQALYYGVVMLLSIFVISLIQKGFFWKYIKVRISFGRLTMVKIRAVNRDFYATGQIDQGFLIYKTKTGKKRINIKDNKAFYRSLGVAWIDLDEIKNAVCYPDYTTVTGYDAEKTEDLLTRALYKPGLKDNTTKLIIGAVLITLCLCVGIGFMIYRQGTQLEGLAQAVSSMKGVIGSI